MLIETDEPTHTVEVNGEIIASGGDEITIGETAAVKGEFVGLEAVIVAPKTLLVVWKAEPQELVVYVCVTEAGIFPCVKFKTGLPSPKLTTYEVLAGLPAMFVIGNVNVYGAHPAVFPFELKPSVSCANTGIWSRIKTKSNNSDLAIFSTI